MMVAQSLRYQLSSFWTWWRGEIARLMPERMRTLFRGGKPARLLYQGEVLRIINQGLNGEEVVGNYLREIDFQDPEQRRVLTSASEIRLCLERKKYLFKKVTLPIETEENLREVLAFEMDRQTPFSADQVYYDYLINGRDKQNRSLDITLILAPVSQISNALEQLQENDIRINAISPCEESDPNLNAVNLLPLERREKPHKRYRYINLLLLLLLLLLLCANLILPLWQKTKQAEALDSALSRFQQQASEVAALKEEVDRARLENRFLETKKRQSQQLLELLHELTLLIPDDTWISHFEIRGDTVHLHGQSLAAAALIPLIESSRLFQNVSFRSPVTQNRQNNTERFHISAELPARQEGRE
ncbi:MAG: PilN domain-containing protein [Candidatus Thiodiazotropha sp. (ex Dulcina madagascariensis)]|nr:PilN domain-containing protein [Candidatus Thiodiazotropha sp. (ex Dulcina madagascariensis)]